MSGPPAAGPDHRLVLLGLGEAKGFQDLRWRGQPVAAGSAAWR